MNRKQSNPETSKLARPHFVLFGLTILCLFLGVVSLTISASTPEAFTPDAQKIRPQGQLPVILPDTNNAQARPASVNEDCAYTPCMALTFDDGPSAAMTPAILDTLSRHQVGATFFVVGSHAAAEGQLLREIHKRGFEIGNHSWNHADFTRLTRGQMLQQINQTQAAVTMAGVPAPTLFRPPYGATNDLARSTVPMTFAYWNIDPEDWKAKSPHIIYDKVMAAARPGAVVVMHDTSPMTVQVLDQLITSLKPHYKLVTFSDLFDLQHSQPGAFYGR